MPAETPPGFPFAQTSRVGGSEVEAPLVQRFVADLNAVLVEQFLNIQVTEWAALVESNGVLDDKHGKSVVVGNDVDSAGQPTLSW